MEFLNKIEQTILGWVKGVPHLPVGARVWLGNNIWWIVLVGAILSGIGVLMAFAGLMTAISLIGTIQATYYASSTFTTFAIVTGLVSLAFGIAQTVLLALAVKPLQLKQKKGWVLLFMSWLVGALSVVVSAVLSFNVFSFIMGIIFGAIWLAISGYFLFEIHGQFAHVEKSRGIKEEK